MTATLSRHPAPPVPRPIGSTIKMTARQFMQLGEDPPGVRLELVNGEIAVSPSPVPNHSRLIVELSHLLTGHVHKHDLGMILQDVDTIFGEHDVRRPDILFFRKDRMHLVTAKKLEGPPDLAVEVISAGSTQIDRRDKFEQYAAGGIPYYWIADPDRRTLEGFSLQEGAYTLCGEGKDDQTLRLPPFSDFEIPLQKLWWPR